MFIVKVNETETISASPLLRIPFFRDLVFATVFIFALWLSHGLGANLLTVTRSLWKPVPESFRGEASWLDRPLLLCYFLDTFCWYTSKRQTGCWSVCRHQHAWCERCESDWKCFCCIFVRLFCDVKASWCFAELQWLFMSSSTSKQEAHRLCPRAEPMVYLALALPSSQKKARVTLDS